MRGKNIILFGVAALLGLLLATPALAGELTVFSPAFEDGGKIPAKHSKDGGNISPEISWTGEVEGVMSYALICEDPDAPGNAFVHWIVYNIPPTVTTIPEGQPRGDELPGVGLQGLNSWKGRAYGGPQPPSGTHRYYFRVMALDTILNFSMAPNKRRLLREAEGHILGEGELMGKFSN